jgi:hypothetical protein
MTKPKLNPNAPIDLSTLYITDEPFVEGRSAQVSKYETIFSKLPKNQRLVCPSGKAGRIGQSLRDWLEKRGHEAAVVRSKERCDDGKGGVWWLEGERAARPIRVKTTFASVAPMAKVSAAPAAPAPGPVAKASAAPGSPFAILDRKRKP